MTFQEELDDDDEWNPCKAAGVCLMLMATCCEDDVVPHVLPFVKNHIRDQDWRYRDAAVMAFGKFGIIFWQQLSICFNEYEIVINSQFC